MRQADGSRLGIWEITPGTVCDTEVEETFVVLCGRATVEIEGAGTVELSSGTICYLPAGARTIWHIHETLRKVYRQFGVDEQ
ncbi:cupin domain-containing protein [Paraburkholderia sp. J8-2]|uniref:cupin domain-containing protein n=1 Tax=Paraburkholderia sp. J8-2 TaxID=2805440 RepID=UPI0039F00B82